MVYAIAQPPLQQQLRAYWIRLNLCHSVHGRPVQAVMCVTAQGLPLLLGEQLLSVSRRTQRNLLQKRCRKNALRGTSETIAQLSHVQGRGFVLPHLPVTSAAQLAQLD